MPNTESPVDNEEEAVTEYQDCRQRTGSENDKPTFVSEPMQIATLEAQVARLEQDRESLRERVDALEAQIRSLEDERELLEAAVKHKEQQRLAVIERYEQILAEQHQRDTENAQQGKIATVLSVLDRALEKSACWLRQSIAQLRWRD